MLLPWTVEQYHLAIRSGVLEEDPAYELLDGLIVRKDRSEAGDDPLRVGNRHRRAVLFLMRLVDQLRTHGCFLQSQQPIALPPHDEPEPDGAIIRGEIDDCRDGPPGPADVLCVIEVADASLRRDRGVKLRAYAAARIPLYVIVNLIDDQVEIYRLTVGLRRAAIAEARRDVEPADSDQCDCRYRSGSAVAVRYGRHRRCIRSAARRFAERTELEQRRRKL
jgi:Uma2 family endonuclease